MHASAEAVGSFRVDRTRSHDTPECRLNVTRRAAEAIVHIKVTERGVEVVAPIGRDRTSVGFRLILVLPHIVLLCLLVFGWFIVTIVAWFVIVFTGRYPEGLEPFALGCLRWLVRVEAYALLLVDEYPPFALA